jgi:hypothetical protein
MPHPQSGNSAGAARWETALPGPVQPAPFVAAIFFFIN